MRKNKRTLQQSISPFSDSSGGKCCLWKDEHKSNMLTSVELVKVELVLLLVAVSLSLSRRSLSNQKPSAKFKINNQLLFSPRQQLDIGLNTTAGRNKRKEKRVVMQSV